MEIKDPRIDAGKGFDWGRVSEDYARFRDIYPEIFYQKITSRGLCTAGQKCLDIGTGTGVLPRNMARFGASWTGTDISPEQIAQAKRLAADAGDPNQAHITFLALPAEQLDLLEGKPPENKPNPEKSMLPQNSCQPAAPFDVITACQCFWYFDHKTVAPILARLLKEDGRLLVLYMAWLPFEDPIAEKSEKLVLKYSPGWTGAGETRHPIVIPDEVLAYFDLEEHEEYDVRIPFTRASWHGRMKACRGVGASLSETELSRWEVEHLAMLETEVPESFEVLHYAALAILRKR